MTYDVVIIGAGLSGLAAADALIKAGLTVRVVEARNRVGGRILTASDGNGAFDMGPAWIWPHDRRMLRLIDDLGLSVGDQYASGRLVFEAADGAIRRDIEMATMAGSLRVAGGLQPVTTALAAGLPDGTVELDWAVARVHQTNEMVHVSTNDGREITARYAVLALPPRLWSGTIEFSPALPAAMTQALGTVPTWMAGHAKIVGVYDAPVWREAGLSGDAISHRGPLVEIHDATDLQSGEAALFGFVAPGLGANAQVRTAASQQLEMLFGTAPRAIIAQDWAEEPFTAVTADRVPPRSHPQYGLPEAIHAAVGPRVLLAGTETGHASGGFLEGALEAAESAVKRVLQQRAVA